MYINIINTKHFSLDIDSTSIALSISICPKLLRLNLKLLILEICLII